RENTNDWALSAASKLINVCLSPEQRIEYDLSADLPCWCQDKSFPALEVWEDDYLTRHPELDQTDDDWNWPKDEPKPNPFTHERDDGWTCPAKGTGYSAPWNDYPDLKALTAAEILGPAEAAYKRLEELGVSAE
ncbi:hypothetical protein N9M10_04685, partial [Hellea sp.]|nr:hypothetical protein [Hellea sp.]